MPVAVDPQNSFLHALSDFWPAFFKDTAALETYYEGAQLNFAQLYLELLEATLGTNLKAAPIWARKYFQLFVVGEHELLFEEGRSPSEDRWVHTPSDPLVALNALMNRAIAPTRVLEDGQDFQVEDRLLKFFKNAFDTDGAGTTEPLFPVRSVSVIAPSTYTDPLGRAYANAKPGDYFRLKDAGGAPFSSRIHGVNSALLYLADHLPEFDLDRTRRSFTATVVRTPYDSPALGQVLETRVSYVAPVTAVGLTDTNCILVPASTDIEIGFEPSYAGPWVAFASHVQGETVLQGGQLYHVLETNTDGTFVATKYIQLAGLYAHVRQAGGENEGLFRIQSTTGTLLTLDRPVNFTLVGDGRANVTVADFEGLTSTRPSTTLPHSYISDLRVTASRFHAVNYQGELLPAFGNVVEGADYQLDAETGLMVFTSIWDPAVSATASYDWLLEVTRHAFTYRGAWATATAYVVGDVVVAGGVSFVCDVAHTSGGSFDATKFVAFKAPFAFDVARDVRQIAYWGVDAYLDFDTLYNNFGYLLVFRRASSEQYRAFLRGVSQLFLLGPTLERFESALNTMANLPVVRDDGEVLLGYDSGVRATGADGEFIDVGSGRDGVLDNSSSTFSSPTATFFASDVGMAIRVKVGFDYLTYLVTTVNSPTEVVVTPTPPADAVDLTWECQHIALTRRFRVSGSYAFSNEDVDSVIWTQSSSFARNIGVFRILAVENASTIVLESEYGFDDEDGVSYALSRTKTQTITTSRTTYLIPLTAPTRADVIDAANHGVLKFQAFETLTTAFVVTDYLEDPTWWHNVTIPTDVLTLPAASGARRRVAPQLIEHVMNPLDQAVTGDFGMAVGVDDEGRAGIQRVGPATWFGGNSVVVSSSPGGRIRDVGSYLRLDNADVHASFQITAVDTAGTGITLDRFPPPEMRGQVPPVTFTGELPPILHRRNVAFIMFDRYLKLHALRVRVDGRTALPPEFVAEATQLLKEAKPAWTYVYFDSSTDFLDVMDVEEEFSVELGVELPEIIRAVDPVQLLGPPSNLLIFDAFRYAVGTQVIPAAVGTYALTPTLPGGSNVRFFGVTAWFDPAVLISGRRPAEGYEYIFDRDAGTIQILTTFPGASTVHYEVVILRTRLPGDPLDAGETRVAVHGNDPTVVVDPGQTKDEAGFSDLAVQITFSP